MTLESLGPYRILDKVGEGAMGEVYRGLDPKLGRPVAIKVIGAALRTDSRAVERLAREGRNASSLNHPAIVTVYDVGEQDGRPYIVMEFIEGRSLWMRQAEGPIRPKEALEIASQVAEGLAAAHAAEIVHRDLKPQNIMITPDGRAKIVDFGVSKAAPTSHGGTDPTVDTRTLTAYDAIVGTVGYMSPEQVTSRHVDGRSDQFALGSILYEMLTRKRAFDRGTAVQTMAAIIEDEPEPLANLCPDLPQSIVTIVERCLAKNPENRYASTRDLARDLRDALTEVLTSPRPITGEHDRIRPSRSWTTVAAGFAAMVTLIGAVPGQQPARRAPAAAAAEAPRQIVVLPISNISQDPGDQILCDGLVETLTSSLTQLERFHASLRVVAASEVRREKATSAKEARQTLGAALAITGALQRDPAGARLTLNLVDASTLVQLSSQTIAIPSGQSAPAQDAIVDAATRLLALPVTGGDRTALRAGGSAAPGAYGDFVRGRGYLQRFDKVENIDLSIASFERAITADPNYALAHAALGEAYWRKYQLSHDAALIDRAEESCRAALKIDGELAPIHVTLAMIKGGRGRNEEAVASAQRALQIDPVNSDAFRELGRAYESMNHPDEAEATYLKAAAARPDDWLAQNALGSFYLAHNKLSEAETAYKRVIALTSDNTRAYNNLGATYFAQKRTEDAAAAWEQSMQIRPTYAASSNLGTYYYDQLRYGDSARNFQKAVDLSPNDYRLWKNLAAALYWAPGKRPQSLTAYQRAAELAEEARRVNPRAPDVLSHLADAYSLLGKTKAARDVVAELDRLHPEDKAVMFTMASVYETIGDRAKALQWLSKAVAAGYSKERVERSPFLAELRKDTRYDALVH